MEIYSKSLADAFERIDAGIELRKPSSPMLRRPSLWKMAQFFLASCWLLKRREKEIDVLMLGDYALGSLALVAKLLSRGRISTVVALHGNDVYFLRQRTMSARIYRVIDFVLRRTRCMDRAVANSTAIQDEAMTRGLAQRVDVVPLATDMRLPGEDGMPAADPPYLLFSGRLIRYKGLSWFVEHVWQHLQSPLELWVAGETWDAGERSCLEGVRGVRYLGAVPYDEMAELRARAIACIMPNRPPSATEQDEGFGLAALEAPAVGCPTLASRCGGLPDAVENGVTGFILQPADVDAWIDKIREIAAWTQPQRESFARTAIQHVRRHYHWDRVARDTLQILHDVADRSTASQ